MRVFYAPSAKHGGCQLIGEAPVRFIYRLATGGFTRLRYRQAPVSDGAHPQSRR
jgi:hypothetical protein